MSTEKIKTDECPNCGKRVNIYKGWITIENNRIIPPISTFPVSSHSGHCQSALTEMIRLFSMVIQPLYMLTRLPQLGHSSTRTGGARNVTKREKWILAG